MNYLDLLPSGRWECFYSDDLPEDGFTVQQLSTLTRSHHSVDGKSADLQVLTNTKPSLEGDADKKDTVVVQVSWGENVT